MTKLKPIVIKQGDYLTKLAHRQGFSAARVWDDPKNAELKELRGEGDFLKPGDVLYVPDEPPPKQPFDEETDNAFKASVPKVPLSVTLAIDGETLADEPYQLEGIGDDSERTTDGDGIASFEVDVHTSEVTIVLPKRDERVRLMIGHLDPPDEPSGARMRLKNLGYYGATVAGEDGYEAHEDGQLKAALTAFQNDQGLEPSGELDAATVSALIEAHRT